MTIAYKLILSCDFLETVATGKIDLDTGQKIVRKLAQATGDDGNRDYNILLDVRQGHSVMSDEDLEGIVKALCKHRESFTNRLAVLHSGRRQEHVDALEEAARRAGFDLRFFTEYEAASKWLHTPIYFDIDFDGRMEFDDGDTEGPAP